MTKEDIMKKAYVERDISWMYFNHRILQEAEKEYVPLLERLSFLGIYSNNLDKNLTLAELKRLYSMMQPLSIEEREISFSLKEDRADVIIPAAEIFLKACEYLKCESIMVPNISLADSIVDGLYEKIDRKSTRLNSSHHG